MIVENELQTSTQQAIAKASLAKQVADAVITETAGEYLHGSELYHKPLVRKLVRDAGQLSVVLSDAYSQGLVGRVFSPMGKERYAYGEVGMCADARSHRRVIKSPVLGYGILITKHSAEEVLDFLESNPGAKYTKSADGYIVRLQFDDKGGVLDFLVSNNMLPGVVKLVEVR